MIGRWGGGAKLLTWGGGGTLPTNYTVKKGPE